MTRLNLFRRTAEFLSHIHHWIDTQRAASVVWRLDGHHSDIVH
jgi:hypothetical protein